MPVADVERAARTKQREDLLGPAIEVLEPRDRADARVDDVEVAPHRVPGIQDTRDHTIADTPRKRTWPDGTKRKRYRSHRAARDAANARRRIRDRGQERSSGTLALSRRYSGHEDAVEPQPPDEGADDEDHERSPIDRDRQPPNRCPEFRSLTDFIYPSRVPRKQGSFLQKISITKE